MLLSFLLITQEIEAPSICIYVPLHCALIPASSKYYLLEKYLQFTLFLKSPRRNKPEGEICQAYSNFSNDTSNITLYDKLSSITISREFRTEKNKSFQDISNFDTFLTKADLINQIQKKIKKLLRELNIFRLIAMICKFATRYLFSLPSIMSLFLDFPPVSCILRERKRESRLLNIKTVSNTAPLLKY